MQMNKYFSNFVYGLYMLQKLNSLASNTLINVEREILNAYNKDDSENFNAIIGGCQCGRNGPAGIFLSI